MDDQLLFLICVTAAVGIGGYFGLRALLTRGDEKVRERLANKKAEEQASAKTSARELFQKIGAAAAKPFMNDNREKASALRRKLNQAGIYTPGAHKLVTGMKVICLVAGIAGGYLLGMMLGDLLLGISVGGLLGYTAPAIWLKMQISQHQKAIDTGLPDALDLMVVCIEAGLSVDAAMQRVGGELVLAHPRLAKELDITHMETRVGVSRAEALKNMGQRSGNAALQSLASMLIQAERFGTSIAGALRVHGESLRQQRQLKAEELAAKASVKLSFPLVLFIFPAVFIILAGPTVVGLMKSPLFKE